MVFRKKKKVEEVEDLEEELTKPEDEEDVQEEEDEQPTIVKKKGTEDKWYVGRQVIDTKEVIAREGAKEGLSVEQGMVQILNDLDKIKRELIG